MFLIQSMNSYGRLSVFAWLYAFLILAPDECDWPASHTGCFYAWGKNRRYPFNRRLGGKQRQYESFGEERNLLHCLKSNSSVTITTTIVVFV